VSDKAIEVLLAEEKSFPPPEEFRRSAHVTSPGVFERARKDAEGLWPRLPGN